MSVFIEKHKFLFLWVLSIFGALSVIPYLMYSGILPSHTSLSSLLVMCTLQAAILYGVICFIAYKLMPRIQISAFPHLPWKSQLLLGVGVGVFIALFIYLADHYVFRTGLLIHGFPLWAGLMASFYGAINEEILCRLFLLPLLFFAMTKFFKRHEHRRNTLFWVANFFVAIAFAAGHLPALYAVLEHPTTLDVARIFILNGIAGMVFGWVFWTRGIWVVMFAHFVADIMLHGGVLGLLP